MKRVRWPGSLALVLLVVIVGFARASEPEARNTLYVFTPATLRPRALEEFLEQGLRSADVDVVVFARISDLRAALPLHAPDAILALPVSLEQLGEHPAIQGAFGGSTEESYSILRRADTTGPIRVVGAFDVVGGDRFRDYVVQMIGPSDLTQVRRVAKVNDLLPLLQFNMADTIVVNSRLVDELRNRSRIPFVVTGARSLLRPAVAFTSPEAQRKLEAAILAVPPPAVLPFGLDSWRLNQ